MSAHGTRSGYMAHRRSGTEACAPCKAAHAKYERDYRRRRRLVLVRLTDEQAEHIRWALRFAKHESEDRELDALLDGAVIFVKADRGEQS